MNITVDTEFSRLLPTLREDELAGLEQSILSDGCRDAIVVWDEQHIIIDGHHRYDICQRHGIPYTVTRLSFATRLEVMAWIIQNQLARRNLNLVERYLLINDLCNMAGVRRGGDRRSQEFSNSHGDRLNGRAAIAVVFGVSDSTITRARRLASTIETLGALCGDERVVREAMTDSDPALHCGDARNLVKLAATDREQAADLLDGFLTGGGKSARAQLQQIQNTTTIICPHCGGNIKETKS
ncbi:MAG: ParB N-terminal domain-containing protein [Gammaproteobacteria bacterium]|nr:ParB N-terminal domain-containing protein [Gammaproteobacteria bacterium]